VSSILENQRSKKNDLHPTMKPISLLEKILNNSTLPKHKVLDLFGGSGSTLIACEKKDRQCYMIELDPKFVQVIIKRFYDVTGGTKEIKCLNRDFDFSFLSN
jgi:DNA modification methylase